MPLDQARDSNFGFPAGFELFQLEGDAKQGGIALNTKAKRTAIEDQEAAWIENYISIGTANARALWGAATPVYNSATIVSFGFYNIGATAYGIVFKLDGSAVQIRLSDGATTTVGAAGTFFGNTDTATPTFVQWSNAGILIVSVHSSNAYWAWDGTLHSPGDATSPSWLNGGTATAMPNGIAGTDIEIFLSRVWIINGTNRLTSVASNGADFTVAHGAAVAANTDSSLRVKYTALMALNGYLYFFGDSECAYVTNVQTSATPTTTYQYTVIDAQIGTPWRDSVIPFGRSLIFANSNGIYALYGSSANKISDALDGIWNDTMADFATVIPSAAVNTTFGVKTLFMCVRTTDYTGTVRNMMVMFDGKKWAVASQNPAPLIIAPQEVNSHLNAYGTDGAQLFEMFATPDASLMKTLRTKLWGGKFGFVMQKEVLRFYLQSEVESSSTSLAFAATLDTENGSVPTPVNLAFGITFINNIGGVLQFQNNSGGNLMFQSNAAISKNDANGSGLLLGFTLTSTSPDYVYERGAIGYKDLTAFY